MRMLGIDPGDKNIGIAVSDPTGTLARPLEVLAHTNRQQDAAEIAAIASREQATQIVVGQATDSEGMPNFSGRKAARLAAAIRDHTDLPVELWDESYSTQKARQSRIELGVNRKDRQSHQDALAAAVILQSYLDHQHANGNA